MEFIHPIRLPAAAAAAYARDGAEVSVAIALVASGVARRVTLSSLRDAAGVAADAVAEAQRSGVSLRLSRDARSGSLTVVVESVRG